jgi:hypothetical protein
MQMRVWDDGMRLMRNVAEPGFIRAIELMGL